MDPQMAAILQALTGQSGATGAPQSGAQPPSPLATLGGAGQGAYALPPPGADAMPQSPPASAAAQNGSLGLPNGSMYSAMMQPPPAPNYWG